VGRRSINGDWVFAVAEKGNGAEGKTDPRMKDEGKKGGKTGLQRKTESREKLLTRTMEQFSGEIRKGESK